MPSNATTAPVYNSTFRFGVDPKRRVQVPAMWRPAEEGTEFTVIVWPKYSEGICLRVMPPKKLEELFATLAAMPNDGGYKTRLKRKIGSQSAQVALDKAGRLCIPDEMAKAAGISDEAVLVGMLDQFEIWNPALHEKITAADEALSQEAFKLLE